ncbi:hypothetical protein EC957_005922 [Mortierella hygrophila]|uniref:Lytic polysaccharide monooxygenase n=1 Tax=Mortierella hygrophila TaxID=979708 RepID=A0A9P6FD99_9FUNG|nr:hypothetical protein EC957_005922 [Mortierella hygrophila]
MMLFKPTLFTTLALYLLAITLTLTLIPTLVQAHTGLSNPCGRYQEAAGCPAPPPGQVVDVDINSPIGTNLRINQPLCKTSIPYPFSSRTIYKAGDTIQTAYSIGSAHGGGHCQWALSYDGEKTWVVIKTMIRTCLQVTPGTETNYRIPVLLPKDLPSGNVTFMWLWYNAIGDRELYSNCADIRVEGSDGGSVKGLAPLIANYGSGYPAFVNEFPNATDPDGSELFDTRPAVTIQVKGSGATVSGTSSGTAPVPTGSNQPSFGSRIASGSPLSLSIAFAASFYLFH